MKAERRATRRQFVSQSLAGCAAFAAARRLRAVEKPAVSQMGFGLVTYQWGKDWDLPTLIRNCETTGMEGVELRTTHAHAVEPNLDRAERDLVRKRFADSPVTLVGLGSNERFDNPDPAVLKRAVAATKDFVKLSHDVGGTGVKVKPDRFHRDVPREKTIEQIGQALNDVGAFASGYGQQIRLEVHGQCAPLPIMHSIIEIADHPSVAICWNCNQQDLEGAGLKANFDLVKHRFGRTCHVRPLDSPIYPTREFLELLVADGYQGWVLLEEGRVPENRVAAMKKQAELFHQFMKRAK